MESWAIEALAAQWLTRRESGNWRAADQAELDAWLEASTAHRVAFLRLDVAWNEAARLRALGAGVPAGHPAPRGLTTGLTVTPGPSLPPPLSALATPRAGAARQRSASRRRGWLLAALGAVASVAVATGLYLRLSPGVPMAQAYRTEIGELRTVILADGSQATLSSDSLLEASIGPQARRVVLQRGEAFFAVRKDPTRPFVVQSGVRRVVAVGTRFDVRQDHDALRVVVTEGMVRMEETDAIDRTQAVLLPAGSIATVDAQGARVQRSSIAEAERQLDWRQGYLSFDDVALPQAVAEINRFNRRPLVLADPALQALRISGSIRWNDLEGFARLLEREYPVRMEAHAEAVILHRR
ncbi:FecR domain-containing protein [Xanthomonas sp. A2111]|uniref:FecR domain-containing protein n=1 Tax=Xanthomonas hawaiiensis TaxID=3003247 RepID=A0ABU2I054_9XANT|nr:FecR domain-containing protein [Xanthomonas sp. A2111]MBO9827958.1 FecR domain-containing protein [Xanthomonas sp. A2111]MDS9991528.1 FecR domain-containing protein [Xanthomonas sp. A2111]